MAMRRSPTKPRLPAVKELNYEDMHILRNSILTDTAVHPVRKLFLEIAKASFFEKFLKIGQKEFLNQENYLSQLLKFYLI